MLATEGALPGITREVVLEILQEEGIPCIEAPVPLSALDEVDELLLTGSLKEVMPAARLGDRPVGRARDFPMARRLRALYRRKVAEACKG